jgi:hypothetical protein
MNILTTERGVWVRQSPGAVGRHTQTEKKEFVDQKINTVHNSTNSVVTQTEKNPKLWSDLVDLETDCLGSSGHASRTNTEAGVLDEVKDVRDEASFPPPKVWVGLSSLPGLLKTLEIPGSNMNQFFTNISLKNRNTKLKGMVEMTSSGGFNEGVKGKQTDYWAMFDDISLMINRTGETLTTGRYVRMFGQWENQMDVKDETIKYSLLDPDSVFGQKCEKLARLKLDKILQQVRSGRYHWGGYDHPNHDYGEYGASRSYAGYGSSRGKDSLGSGYGGYSGGYGAFGGYDSGYRFYKK